MRPFNSGLAIRRGAPAEHPVGYEALVAASFRRVADDLGGKDPIARQDAEAFLQWDLGDKCDDLGLPPVGVLHLILRWAQELGYTPPQEILDLVEDVCY